MQDLVSRLSSVQHFKHLSLGDLTTIVAAGHVKHFKADEIIYHEGESCAGMFVLLSGQVQLRIMSPQGQEHIMIVIDPVIMFNEVTVLDGGVNLTTAVAIKDCITWQISHEQFQMLMQKYPVMGLGLLQVLATRTRFLIAQAGDLSFRSALARTAKVLLDLSQRGKRPIDRRAHSNDEIASMVVTAPEAISRMLKSFQNRGYISFDRLTITLEDVEALEQLAHGGVNALKG